MDLSLKKFWSFKEDSEWEGIVWRTFFPVENNEEAIAVIKQELFGIEDDIIKETYSIEEEIYEYEVDVLIKYSNHDVYSKIEKKLDIKKIRKAIKTLLTSKDPFYKGGIRLMTCN